MLKVTVITVCYNEKDRLEKTLQSVCDQTYPCIEYLIIDGASTDGTVDMLKEYSSEKDILFYSGKDHGIYDAMNRGIARASGDYVYFLNAGDRFYNETVVEDVISFIKDRKTIYYGNVCMVYADGLKQIRDFSGLDGKLTQELYHGGMPCHQAIFSPRDALINHLFRETYRIRADFEWLLHSVENGYESKSIPVVISCYDSSGTSSRLKNYKLFLQEERAIIREYREKSAEDKTLDTRETESGLRENAWKYECLFSLMSCWLALKQKNVSVAGYFKEKHYSHVAIYGMGRMGLRLQDELEDQGIWIDYAIDRNKENLRQGVKLVSPDEELYEADAVIVTAVDSFYEIEKLLRGKLSCPILSLEDLIYDVWEKSERTERKSHEIICDRPGI